MVKRIINFRKLRKRFLENDRGAVMPLFAVALLPIVLLTGIVVDVGRQAYINTQLAYACDAAAIAGARYNIEDVQANATKVFYANYLQDENEIRVTPVVTVSPDQTIVTVSASAEVSMFFGKLLGQDTLPIRAEAQVRRQMASSQIAMVLDVTGSMAYNTGIDGLREASRRLVEVVFEGNETLDTTAISLVPYAASVNIGNRYRNWLSNPSRLNDFPRNEPWAGCVGAVDTGNVMDTDAPPSRSRTWPVYFAESTLNKGLPTPRDNDWRIRPNGTLEVLGPLGGENVRVGPNRSCSLPILPLTNNKKVLLDRISQFTSANLGFGGGTFGNLGIVWGWNTISPRWKGLWQSDVQPTDYGAENLKSMVIVTDGENLWHNAAENPIGDPTAYNFGVSQNRATSSTLGISNISQAQARIDARVTSLCDRIKAQGIQVFTVTFRVSAPSAQQLYRDCASRPEWAFQAESAEDLYNQFSQIGSEVKRITIIK